MGAAAGAAAADSQKSFIGCTMTAWSDELRAHDLSELRTILDMHGCAIVQTHATMDSLESLHNFMVSSERAYRPREAGRYSINAPNLEVHPAFAPLNDSPIINACIDELVRVSTLNMQGPHRNWLWKPNGTGGDIVMPHTYQYQHLHSDDPNYPTSSMLRGYSLCIGLAVTLVHLDFAPTRLVSWSTMKKLPYPEDATEPVVYGKEFMLTLKPGEAVIRDSRAAHSGTPNYTDAPRPFAQSQVLMPQYIGYYADETPTYLSNL